MSNSPPFTELELSNLKEWVDAAPDHRQRKEFFTQGWEEEQILSMKPSEMLCTICKTFPRCAFILPCGHYFCQRCLTNWFFIAENRTFNNAGLLVRPCPNCRSPFGSGDIHLKPVSDFNDTVILKCANEGCDVNLSPLAMQLHEVLFCENRVIDCPSPDCEILLKKEDTIRHFTRCPVRNTMCQTCGLCYRVTMKDHKCIETMNKSGEESDLSFTQPPLNKHQILLNPDYLSLIRKHSWELEHQHSGFTVTSLQGSAILIFLYDICLLLAFEYIPHGHLHHTATGPPHETDLTPGRQEGWAELDAMFKEAEANYEAEHAEMD